MDTAYQDRDVITNRNGSHEATDHSQAKDLLVACRVPEDDQKEILANTYISSDFALEVPTLILKALHGSDEAIGYLENSSQLPPMALMLLRLMREHVDKE